MIIVTETVHHKYEHSLPFLQIVFGYTLIDVKTKTSY